MIDVMYRLCNKNRWFIGGTVEQYDKLFNMVKAGRSTKDLALVIFLCTPNWSEKAIYEELCKNGFKRN